MTQTPLDRTMRTSQRQNHAILRREYKSGDVAIVTLVGLADSTALAFLQVR